jgi:hypothetical protein
MAVDKWVLGGCVKKARPNFFDIPVQAVGQHKSLQNSSFGMKKEFCMH